MTLALKLTVTWLRNKVNIPPEAEYICEEHIFVEEAGQGAFSKCQEYIDEMNLKSVLGWNLEIYPKIRIEKICLK